MRRPRHQAAAGGCSAQHSHRWRRRRWQSKTLRLRHCAATVGLTQVGCQRTVEDDLRARICRFAFAWLDQGEGNANPNANCQRQNNGGKYLLVKRDVLFRHVVVVVVVLLLLLLLLLPVQIFLCRALQVAVSPACSRCRADHELTSCGLRKFAPGSARTPRRAHRVAAGDGYVRSATGLAPRPAILRHGAGGHTPAHRGGVRAMRTSPRCMIQLYDVL